MSDKIAVEVVVFNLGEPVGDPTPWPDPDHLPLVGDLILLAGFTAFEVTGRVWVTPGLLRVQCRRSSAQWPFAQGNPG